MTEDLKRHKNYIWGLPDFDEKYRPGKNYPADWATISLLHDIRDALIELQRLATPRWWQFWR